MKLNQIGIPNGRRTTMRLLAPLTLAGLMLTVISARGQNSTTEASPPPPPNLAPGDSKEPPEEGPPQPWEKGSLKVGGFAATFTSKLAFGLNTSAGASLDAEDLLGLDSSLAVLRADALYRPGKTRRNQFDIGYAGYHRSGDTTLTREITIRGNTYPVGAHVDTTFNFDLIRASYSYAFIQNERVRIGLGLGIYAVPVKYGLEIQTSSGRSAVEGADTAFPLPALALRAEVQILPCLFFNANVDGMYMEISDFKGSMVDLTTGLEYRPWQHFGLGVAYGFTAASVEGQGNNSSYPGINFVGSVDIRFSGVLLYGKLSF